MPSVWHSAIPIGGSIYWNRDMLSLLHAIACQFRMITDVRFLECKTDKLSSN